MKNKEAKPESIFKKKGFYIALYSCLGVVMISAAALSFTSLMKTDSPAPEKNQPILDFSQLQTTDQNYLIPEDREIAQRDANVNLAEANPNSEPKAVQQPVEQPPATQATATQPPTAQATTAPVAEAISKPEEKQAEANAVDEEPEAVAVAKIVTPKPQEPIAAYTPYTDETAMAWPVLGEIVMDFSDNHVIYDKTLQQYRTNDNLCIAAAIGTQVKATSEGVVKEVTKTKENGNTVVIDHGNGWMTTYSQLQDSVLVKKGDVVKVGQAIGGIGAPSIYNVLLGSHLEFSVNKEGKSVDPKIVLAK